MICEIDIWEVKLNYEFNSSSQGKNYSKRYENMKFILCLQSKNLDDVLELAKERLGNQYRCVEITEASWLGIGMLNPYGLT